VLRHRIGFGTFAALLWSTGAFAGAWTFEEGHGQFGLTATTSRADEVFDGKRRLQTTPRYDKFEFQGLFEYGVTDWFTAILSTGLQHIDIGAPVQAERNGLGYTEFGGRLRFARGDNWVLSGQATFRVPGTFDTGNPAAIGHNGFEQDLRLLFGYSFSIGAWPAFLDLQVAQRFRGGGPPNEFRADVTFGVRPLPQWLVLVQLFNVVAESAKPPVFPSYDYSKLQLSVVHELNKQWAVQGGGFTTVSGRNGLQENGLLVGTWYKF
jgi:hypothetical protein